MLCTTYQALSRGHGQLPMWVTTLLDICRLMGNYPISYINIAYKAVSQVSVYALNQMLRGNSTKISWIPFTMMHICQLGGNFALLLISLSLCNISYLVK